MNITPVVAPSNELEHRISHKVHYCMNNIKDEFLNEIYDAALMERWCMRLQAELMDFDIMAFSRQGKDWLDDVVNGPPRDSLDPSSFRVYCLGRKSTDYVFEVCYKSVKMQYRVSL